MSRAAEPRFQSSYFLLYNLQHVFFQTKKYLIKIMLSVVLLLTLRPSTCLFQKTKIILLYPPIPFFATFNMFFLRKQKKYFYTLYNPGVSFRKKFCAILVSCLMRATCSKLKVAINKFQKAFSFYSRKWETSNVKAMSLLWNVNIPLQSELLLLIFISTRTWWRPVANRTKDLSGTQSSSGLLLCIFSWKV